MILDHVKLAQMLAAEAFYDAVPGVGMLRKSALAAAARWQAALNDKECSRCGAMKNMSVIVDSFRRILPGLADETREHIRQYLRNKIDKPDEEFWISVKQDRMVKTIKL